MSDAPLSALLLLGPTGSGKTPLGKWLEMRGIHGVECVHFDFGENLRETVALHTLKSSDVEFLKTILSSGALLEDSHFPIAERILRSFLVRRAVDGKKLVVLNGLPRHVGQAEAVESIVHVGRVVVLECSVATVMQRLQNNVGGDREGRSDDVAALVRKKLDDFEQRTMPMIEFYRRRGASIQQIEITPEMTAEDAARKL